MEVSIELCKIVVWVCRFAGCILRASVLNVGNAGDAASGRGRRCAAPHGLAYRLAGQGRGAGTTLRGPRWMSQKNETRTLEYV